GERLYRTGDAVKQTQSGEFEFIGRVDEQVKIRGYRVELNEIKQHLLALDAVSDAAVLVESQDDRAQLYGFVVAEGHNKDDNKDHKTDNQTLNITHIKEALSARLPDYMIPSRFIILADLPLNANGKLDKKA
ncbi:non-ribosomal peptide synthetase, partial [Alteromonas sp. 5E99-2]|nr:non-ribosomal peptide synthetase [Alteromonas sp. 5E99-2]